MKQTQIIMDMPVTIEIVDSRVTHDNFRLIFDYFKAVDARFSPFKSDSELTHFNQGSIRSSQLSADMKTILTLAEETKKMSGGYFDITHTNGLIDPSGIVKGWAIYQASRMVEQLGYLNYFIDAGGDIQTNGLNDRQLPWKIGIRNPFNRHEHVKIVSIGNKGIATSGTAIRGQHIYDPFKPLLPLTDYVSFTVIGPNVFEADRFATAAFAMREKGLDFITNLSGFEAYQIDATGIARFTSGFQHYVV